MIKKLPGLIAGTVLFFAACGANSSDGINAEESSSSVAGDSLQPVETKEANTSYQPAFAGQTRAPGVKTNAAFNFKVVSSDLKKPWGLVELPDGRILITEKEGSMRIIDKNGQMGEGVQGIPEVNSKGQGGLLGVTIDPAFEQNRMLYWTFSESTQGGTLTAVAKGKLSADSKRLEGVSVIYRATPAYNGNLHYGSRILFDKQGNLFVSTGERSDKSVRAQAQDLKSGLGKIVRITTSGQPAPGNPFEGNANARPEIYSYGHRNVQGLAFHPETGELWENEFGPRGGDEVNLIQAGKNYGWPIVTYGIEYSGDKIGEAQTQREGMQQPVYFWDPVVSPSGMTFYSGDAIPEWKNNLFVACLNTPHIARLVIRDNRVVGEERLLADEKQRFRAIIESRDGALYAVTDSGRLYRIGAGQ